MHAFIARSVKFVAALALAAAFTTAGSAEPTTPTTPAVPAGPKAKSNVVHIYLLRGLFNVFSTGMDGISDKLEKRHIYASVHSHLMWRFLADDAIDDYRKGKVGKIIIMGHSAGATNAVDMADKIGAAGVPVSLVVALDPSMRSEVTSNNVRWVVNLYLPEGMYGYKVTTAPGYKGRIENIELHDQLIDHVSLDKVPRIQDRAINYALKAIKGGGVAPGATAKNSAVASDRTGSVKQTVKQTTAPQ